MIQDMIRYTVVVVINAPVIQEFPIIVAFIILDVAPGPLIIPILVLCDCGYHQADPDTDYLIFSCGCSLTGTYYGNSWVGTDTSACGLFNTSGDTEPDSTLYRKYIGSLNDKTHLSDDNGFKFFLAGRDFEYSTYPEIVHTSGIYYSGCGYFVDYSESFGSQCYYFL